MAIRQANESGSTDSAENDDNWTDSRFVRHPDSGTIHKCIPFGASDPPLWTDTTRCGSYHTGGDDVGIDADDRAEMIERFDADALCGTCIEQREGDE